MRLYSIYSGDIDVLNFVILHFVALTEEQMRMQKNGEIIEEDYL